MNKKLIISLIIGVSLIGAGSYVYVKSLPTETNIGATVLRVSQGGTGATTFPAGECLKGNLTGAITSGACAEGSGITSLNGLTGTEQTFATTSSGNLTLNLTSTSTIHTITTGVASGYNIPTTASTTDWNTVTLNEVQDLTANKVFALANNNLEFNYKTPAGHAFVLSQDTGNPTSGTHLLHINAEDPDVLPLHIVHTGTPTPGYFLVSSSSSIPAVGDIFTINSSGYVGIGTTSPSALLTVGATSSQQFLVNSVGGITAVNASTTNLTVATNSELGTITSGTWNGSDIGLAYLAGGVADANSYDFGGATSLEIVNGTVVVTDTAGEIGIDTTSGQLRYNDGTATRTLSSVWEKSCGILAPVAGDLVDCGKVTQAITLSNLYCLTDTASSTAATTTIDYFQSNANGVSSSTVLNGNMAVPTYSETSTTTTSSITSGNRLWFRVVSIGGTPAKLSCTAKGAITAD